MTTTRRTLLGIALGLILICLTTLPAFLSVPLQTTATALTGRVTSAAEGAMEGVLVSAKREGSNITITVVSNATGTYAFPQDRLQPGRQAITVRAAGYVLPATKLVDITAKPAAADLRLDPASGLEKAHQLTSAEWLYSYPLPEERKYATLRDCTRCDSQSKPAMSTYGAPTLAYVVERMIYSSGTTPPSFQRPANTVANWGRLGGIMATEP